MHLKLSGLCHSGEVRLRAVVRDEGSIQFLHHRSEIVDDLGALFGVADGVLGTRPWSLDWPEKDQRGFESDARLWTQQSSSNSKAGENGNGRG